MNTQVCKTCNLEQPIDDFHSENECVKCLLIRENKDLKDKIEKLRELLQKCNSVIKKRNLEDDFIVL